LSPFRGVDLWPPEGGEVAPSETITIKTRREGKQPGPAATCIVTILIPIRGLGCSRLSDFSTFGFGGWKPGEAGIVRIGKPR